MFPTSTNIPQPRVIYLWQTGYNGHPVGEPIAARGEYPLDVKFIPVPAYPSGEGVPESNAIILPPNVELLQISVGYTPTGFSHQSDVFKFYAERDAESNWSWIPMGRGNIWTDTNMPIIPVPGFFQTKP